MSLFKCEQCGMSVGEITCGTCDKELEHDTIQTDDDQTVHVSKCPDGHGMIKSPMCCGKDMVCNT